MDIGFYVLDIEPNNTFQNQILSSINDLCKLRPYDNIVLFNNQFNKLDNNHKYYILHIQQAKYFDGILFVFDTKSAMLTQTFPCPKKQILYITEPEWSKNPSLPYGFWYNIYMKEQNSLIANSQEMYDLLDICWKKPVSLMSSINSKDLDNVISQL